MLDVLIIFFIQFIPFIVSIRRFVLLKRKKQAIMYHHEVKSYLDTYKWLSICTGTNFVCWCIILLLVSINNSFTGDLTAKMEILYTLFACRIIYLLIMTYSIAFSMYLVTEIKHLSPEDGIGKQNYKDKSIEAWTFFKSGAWIGITILFVSIYQAFRAHIIIGIISIVMFVFLYVFGMGDVLQHDGYNSPEYHTWYKKQNILEQFYVPNIIRFFSNRDYRTKSLNVLSQNTQNILRGFKYSFLKAHIIG